MRVGNIDSPGLSPLQSDKSDLLVNALYSVYYELGSQFPLTGLTSAQRPALQGIKSKLCENAPNPAPPRQSEMK